MVRPLLQIGRNLSEHRIAAYECTVEGSVLEKHGEQVAGWYGMFDDQRLRQEIVPKLTEYASHGASYPFLITSSHISQISRVGAS